jgi:predicted lysophospholipase L1 biosynthesis ABC-type transport system permease subunit
MFEDFSGVDPALMEYYRHYGIAPMHNVSSPRIDDDGIEQEIQAKGLTAARVTPPSLESNIRGEQYFTVGDAAAALGQPVHPDHKLVTICVLTMQNGFTVIGDSACASPANFDAAIGRKLARAKAVDKIWPLLGYALKQRMYDQEVATGA